MFRLEDVILTILQGLAEWWPISSSAVVSFASLKLGYSIEKSLEYALSLHLGSGLAVLLVFRKDLIMFFEGFSDKSAIYFNKKSYIYSLILSFLVALPLYLFIKELWELYGYITLLIMAFGLLVTTFLLEKGRGLKKIVSDKDMLVTGLLQGISVLPGFSRKGLTTGYLIIKEYEPEIAVKVSFLLGAPALISAGLYNSYILVKSGELSLSTMVILQTIVFVLSVVSAKSFLKFSQKVNARFFTLFLAIFIILSVILESMS
uniref:Undecaprenyl-diphosphatase n=1 Tax=Staphylothermus marinus TaxID=2280 RepID=A0A7C4NMN8_STAMA